MKTAFLFPAFAMKFKEDFRRDEVDGYLDEAEHYLDLASRVVHVNREKFNDPDQCVLDDELEDDLQAHYACYIDDCALGSLASKRIGSCDYVAGYSMGLFPALHHCGAVSFEDGLVMMHRICKLAGEAVAAGEYGMGFLVGLTPAEVAEVIQSSGLEAEIADVCGKRVVFISGRRPDVEAALDACVAQGCLQARLLPVRLPFHSSFMRNVEGEARSLLARAEIRAPRCPVVSSIDQRVLRTAEEVRSEVVTNVARPMNWFQTVHQLLDLGVDVLLECGASDSLSNLALRNIKRSYSIYNCRQFERLFAVNGRATGG